VNISNKQKAISRKIKTYFLSLISYHLSPGFTLIELVVSMMVLLVVGSVVGSILSSSLRSTNKTNTIATVSQNGSFAILQMAKMIQGAQSLNGVSTDGTNFVSCVPAAVTITPTPTPSQYKAVKITSFDGGQTTFSCNGSSDTPPNTIASISASSNMSLINTSSVSLEASSCYFMCTQNSAVDYPVVQINFALREYSPTGSVVLSERTASASAIPFQTTIRVRNAGR